MRAPTLLAAVVLVGAAACACTSGTPDDGAVPRTTAESGDEAPRFTGPWSDAFTQAYRDATTDSQRAILEDERVTDAEYAQVRDGFARCLADVGYAVTWEPGGGFTLDVGSSQVDDARVQDTVSRCDELHRGDVDHVYEQVVRNPQNLDESALMSGCLVRKGVVAGSFTARDYAAWFDAPGEAALPFTVDEVAGDVAFAECNADPLGLLE